MTVPTFIRGKSGCIQLMLRVQPRAARNEIVGQLDDALRVKISAPPVDSAANAALIGYLAERLGCRRNRLRLVRGHKSRHKVVEAYDISPEEAARRLVPPS